MFWIVVALNVLWRSVRYGMNFPLWGDEAFVAISFFVRDFAGMLDPLEYGQIAPVVFMWGEWCITTVFGHAEWSLRLLPFLIGIASIFLFTHLARAILPPRSALLAVGAFSAAYFPMRYGAEVKPYGLDLFCTLAILCMGWKTTQSPNGWRSYILLTVICMASVWCSYPSVFISGSVGLVMTYRLIRKPGLDLFVGWILLGTALIVSFVLMLRLVAVPHLSAASWLTEIPMWQRAFPPWTEPWQLPWWLIRTHTGELLAYPVGGKNGASVLPLILVLTGAISLCRRRCGLKVFLLLSPLILTLIAASMKKYPYGGGPRVSLYMAPAFCLLLGAGLTAWFSRLKTRQTKSRAIRITIGIFTAMIVAGTARDIVKPYHSHADRENRTVIETLASRSTPNTTWIVYNSLRNESHSPNLYAWGGSAARFRYYVTLLAPVRVIWSPMVESHHPSKDETITLLVYHDNKVSFPEELLAQYLNQAEAAWGSYSMQSHLLGGRERIDVYHFISEYQSRALDAGAQPEKAILAAGVSLLVRE